MAQYNLPRSPTARASRRAADLQVQHWRKRAQVLRRDRRRAAFETARRRRKLVRHYRARRHTAATKAQAAEQTAQGFGCSASTVRHYDRCYRKGGLRALVPAYRRRAQPQMRLDFALVGIILALRVRLGWCGQRIAVELEQRQIAQISHMSVYRVFRRYGVPTRTYHPVGRCDGILYRKQRVRAPNWTWHVDFAGPWTDQDGIERSLVVVIDSYSRYLLALELVEQQSAEAVETLLATLFARYGTPTVLITDNGRAFAPSKPEWQHRFGRFLSEHQVEHRRTRPYYPQTNGKVEAAIKTIERELLARLGWRKGASRAWRWSEIDSARAAFEGWYNFYRAHSALDYRVPAVRYAGVALEKRGLANIFGLLPSSALEVERLPVITRANRLDRLSLALVV